MESGYNQGEVEDIMEAGYTWANWMILLRLAIIWDK